MAIQNDIPFMKEKSEQSMLGPAVVGGAVGLLSGILLADVAGKKEIMKRLRNLNRKYQIFLSSTFKDLIEERQEVINTILDTGHIPISMERFSASSKTQMDYIQKAMDDCDYLVLVLADRYGTTMEYNGRKISYTEMEFEHALKIGIPILPFIKERSVPLEGVDEDEVQMLEDFKKRVEKHSMRSGWPTLKDLKYGVYGSIKKEIEDNPQSGWVRWKDIDPNSEYK